MPTKALFLLPVFFLLYVAIATDFFPHQWAAFVSTVNLSGPKNNTQVKKQPQDCSKRALKFCKSSHVNGCDEIAVSVECPQERMEQIGSRCGHPNATLYDTRSACNAPRVEQSCPELLQEITTQDVPHIAQCEVIHKDLCKQACGERYDYAEVRNFIQTGGKPALLCMDGSLESSKNGVLLEQDINRKTCMELHHGKASWCVNYNKTVNNVALGAFVACSGKIQPNPEQANP